MFDLFRSRDKAVRILLGGILVVVAASMVTYLIPGTSMGLTNDDTWLLQIDGNKLTQADFQKHFAIAIQNMQMPPQMAPSLYPEYLDQEAAKMGAMYVAHQLGLTASDDEVYAAMISQLPAQFIQNGVVDKDQFGQYLATVGMSIQDYTDGIRDQLILVKLQDAVLEGIVVSPKEVEDEFAKRYEKAKISYIAFPPAKFTDEVKPNDDELRKVFELDKDKYPVPAKTSFQVVVVDQDKVAASMKISDAELHQAYSASMDNFRTPERIKVRHILISTEGKSDKDKQAAKAKADDILKQLKSGGDFAELAKKDSDDKGTGDRGGELDWIVKGQMPPDFESAAFALKKGETSGVVTTSLGYDIVQVEDREPARIKPFDEVKANLEDELKKENLTDKVQMEADSIRAALQKDSNSADAAAKQYDAQLISVPEGEAGKPIPGLGVAPEIDQTLSEMKPNDVSQVVSLPSNRLAVVVLKARIPARLSTYDEVKDQVKQKYVLDKAKLIAESKAKDAVAQIQKGEDIEKVAKANKLEVVTSSLFGRADSVEGLGQASYVQAAFTKPIGSVLGPSEINGKYVVSKVLEQVKADPSALAAQRDDILLAIKKQKAQERADMMLDSIRSQLAASGKLKRNEAAIRALANSYQQSANSAN